MNDYYMAQYELEQQELRMQFEEERAMDLRTDDRMEMDMEREMYEC